MRFIKPPANMQAMQARYDRLSGMNSRNPNQQARMDRLGARLNLAGGMGPDSTMGPPPGPASTMDPSVITNGPPPGMGGGMGPPPGMGGGMGPPPEKIRTVAMKKGGVVKASSKSTAKNRDGIAQRGKTKGKMC